MLPARDGLDETKYTLIEHLSELRTRLMKAIGGILVTTLACGVFSGEILDYAIQPLVAVLEDRNRVETALVAVADDPSAAALVAKLEADPDVRFHGRYAALAEAAEAARTASRSRRPIDLLLVSARGLGDETLLVTDALEGVEPSPFVAYLVADKADPLIAQLQLEGALVVLDPPRPAVVDRVLRRAAASAGKTTATDKLVVLSPFEVFFAYLKIALVCGLFLACPVWIYQAWAFVAPGLYTHEKRFVLPVVASGSLLFVGGGLFAYYGMFPLMFDVLVNQLMPENLAASFTVDKYLGLLLQMTVAFGVVFELPLALALLSTLGIVDAARLRKYRKHAFVAAFIIGAVLTPADPISQTMMAVPLVVFYELGILLSAVLAEQRRRATETALVPVGDDGSAAPSGEDEAR